MTDSWLVVVGYPPWHFGPFDGEAAAAKFAEDNNGRTWPLWEPEEQDAISGRKAIEQAHG